MSVDSIFAASRFGLDYQRLRLEAASHNIAVANTPSVAGHAAQLMRVALSGDSGFEAALGAASAGTPQVVAVAAGERQIRDPSDPMADKNGMVSYPRVDLVDEMSTLVEASRAYEANVRAFNTLRSMALHALDVGGGS